jgi:hypothetical protein
MRESDKEKTGPKPDHLKIEGDWKDAIGVAVKRKRPKEGWPEPDKDKKKKH